MAPRRKTRGWLTANRQDDQTVTAGPIAHRKKLPPSKLLRRDEANVEEWVCRFLGNLAAIEQNKYKPQKRTTTFRINNERRKSAAFRRLRSPTPFSWDRVTPRLPNVVLGHPTESDASDGEEKMPLPLPPPPSSSSLADDNIKSNESQTRHSPANVKPTAKAVDDDENRTLLQKINRYIKAGIAEGKRRAKRYVRKALSFALEMGYLVPADTEGKLLRVSAALVNAPRLSDTTVVSTKRRATRQVASSGRVRRRIRRKPRTRTTRGRRNSKRSSRRRVKRRGQGDDLFEEMGTAPKRRNDAADEENKRRATTRATTPGRTSRADDELEKSSTSASTKIPAHERSSRSPSRSGSSNQEVIFEKTTKFDSSEIDRKPQLPIVQRPKSTSSSRRELSES